MDTDACGRAPLREGNEASLLPWDRFAAWARAICVVTFDLELGQAMELTYPPHIQLTDKEKTNICYLSFPDSNSGCHGDTQFCFRIRQSPSRKSPATARGGWVDGDAPGMLRRDPTHYYGYVYFRQAKDKSLRRGYFQKSLVLLSPLPYAGLFDAILRTIAPGFFEKAEPFLEAVCNDMDQWPLPVAGQTLSLPIMGTVIQVRIPSRQDKPGAAFLHATQENLYAVSTVLPSVHQPDLYRSFRPVLRHVQMLWELVLLGEPLVVMATSPADTSQAVLALVSCIAPLTYHSDFRPYFTIHDSEFQEYTTRTQAPPPVILGVTNPFFAKTLQHWPHIIRLGHVSSSSDGDVGKSVKVKKQVKLKTLDSEPGVYTAYKPFLSRDKAILRELEKGEPQTRPPSAQNSVLRRQLLELTQSFIIPLERYVASLMPLQKNITPFKSPPPLGPFQAEDFIRTLEKNGPQLTSPIKGDWTGFYRRFVRSPNFAGWLRERQGDMRLKLEAVHMDMMANADLSGWVRGRSEVESVDWVIKLREKMAHVTQAQVSVGAQTLVKLRAHVDAIISSLPPDLQGVLGSGG
uniref:Protein DENND6A isoform X1 n=1 Tax=Petromyzon marinus TaxID=7757 RepID=A0AAJ7X8T5_PETMA|nr:protein DENND6A isoform X1 [Petromyzon marinus]